MLAAMQINPRLQLGLVPNINLLKVAGLKAEHAVKVVVHLLIPVRKLREIFQRNRINRILGQVHAVSVENGLADQIVLVTMIKRPPRPLQFSLWCHKQICEHGSFAAAVSVPGSSGAAQFRCGLNETRFVHIRHRPSVAVDVVAPMPIVVDAVAAIRRIAVWRHRHKPAWIFTLGEKVHKFIASHRVPLYE